MAGNVSVESCHTHVDDVQRRFEAVHVKIVAKLWGDECYFLHVLIFRDQLMDWEVYETEVSFKVLNIGIV